MAVLSQKATDGRLSFVKYVTDNKRYAEVEFSFDKGLSSPLYTVKGSGYEASKKVYSETTKFSITDTKLYDQTGLKLAKVKLIPAGTVGFFPISKIRKPTAVNATAYEDEVVDAINAFILDNGGTIDIKLGSKTYKKMSYAIKVDAGLKREGNVRGDPKADIIVCVDNKNPLAKSSIYISHKKEGGPEAFQQYGGLSTQAGEEIYNHKATQAFLKNVSELIGTGKQLPHPVMMTFADDNLANMSIYGPEYGGDYSLQHTQLIGQGKPVFKKLKEGLWELSFSSHMSLSGDLSHFKEGYLPVFGATFRAGRGFDYKGKRYDGARVAIYPQKLMATRSGLVILKG